MFRAYAYVLATATAYAYAYALPVLTGPAYVLVNPQSNKS